MWEAIHTLADNDDFNAPLPCASGRLLWQKVLAGG